MNVILVPSGTGSGRSSSLPHRHLLLILLIGGLVLPVFLGVLAYRINALIERHGATPELIRRYG
ncbi:MAG TPA: hypothetical protein VF203_09175, partial [Burkholderiales bacterium]